MSILEGQIWPSSRLKILFPSLTSESMFPPDTVMYSRKERVKKLIYLAFYLGTFCKVSTGLQFDRTTDFSLRNLQTEYKEKTGHNKCDIA